MIQERSAFRYLLRFSLVLIVGVCSAMSLQDALVAAEEKADGAARAIKPYILPWARILLLSTFIEDGFRMIVQFNEQWIYLSREMFLGWLGLAPVFILANIVLQFGGSALIISNQKVMQGVQALMAVIVLQIIGYTTLHSFSFFLRTFSLFGSLLLVLAEARDNEGKSMFVGGLTDERETRTKTYLQLAGRCLIVLMQLSLIHGEMSFFRTLTTFIEGFLIVLVAIGYKTKLSAFVLVVLLLLTNMFINPFWNEYGYRADVLRYDFFQTLSITGGLLYIVHLGGGDISMDRQKKDY